MSNKGKSRIRTLKGTRYVKLASLRSRVCTFGVICWVSCVGYIARTTLEVVPKDLFKPKIASSLIVASSGSEGVVEIASVSGQLTTPTPSALPETKSDHIEAAVDEFLSEYKSESLMIMHCLAHRENGHGGNPDAHGDNGLAGGPFQFHQATWDRMRVGMKKQGLVVSEATRYDFKESARTTAWAIKNGRALEWGPILRASKGSTHATCQVPHWYRK